jgi:hypothetical protein
MRVLESADEKQLKCLWSQEKKDKKESHMKKDSSIMSGKNSSIARGKIGSAANGENSPDADRKNNAASNNGHPAVARRKSLRRVCGVLLALVLATVLLAGCGDEESGGFDSSKSSKGWAERESNSGQLNTEVAASARDKFTKIKGGGKDVTTVMVYMRFGSGER